MKLPFDDDVSLEKLSTEELAELAGGRDLALKAPALSQLGARAPDVALPLARRLVGDEDELVAAAAVRVLDATAPDEARRFMLEHAATAPVRVLDAMVERLAVDAPVAPAEHPELLETIARRLRAPETDEEHYLSQLLFRRYPGLARTGS